MRQLGWVTAILVFARLSALQLCTHLNLDFQNFFKATKQTKKLKTLRLVSLFLPVSFNIRLNDIWKKFL